MIPTLILFGLVFGRWWRLSLIAAALGWPVLLAADDVMSVGPGLLGASGLAIANAGVGVLIHQGILRMMRVLRTEQDR
ncbi:hypothetical protein [Micromonospora parathelypteridis]|uniref:Uncharacterized protein n=1 Tax=Micromonospora parathelypteridis TaxID=1839617 RepID=A0A840VZN0_9ACTN|nr:hypothetical protein [Micromonospora parathelypteridis]MBB5481436.1 hypothetical protein [Micromonospora parathelypteridis]GGO18510.1 hypothetical protein GCM10011576_33580 [Micromonospora parathelypteridis]